MGEGKLFRQVVSAQCQIHSNLTQHELHQEYQLPTTVLWDEGKGEACAPTKSRKTNSTSSKLIEWCEFRLLADGIIYATFYLPLRKFSSKWCIFYIAQISKHHGRSERVRKYQLIISPKLKAKSYFSIVERNGWGRDWRMSERGTEYQITWLVRLNSWIWTDKIASYLRSIILLTFCRPLPFRVISLT